MTNSMNVPYDQIQPETLRNLVQEFVLREATDYGSEEVGLETKIDQVIDQLKKGKASIVFDDYSKSCSIVAEHN